MAFTPSGLPINSWSLLYWSTSWLPLFPSPMRTLWIPHRLSSIHKDVTWTAKSVSSINILEFLRTTTIALSFHPILPMAEKMSGVVSANLWRDTSRNKMPKCSLTSKEPVTNSLRPKIRSLVTSEELERTLRLMLLKSSNYFLISKQRLMKIQKLRFRLRMSTNQWLESNEDAIQIIIIWNLQS